MLLQVLRQFAAVVCNDVAARHSGELEEQPGRLFFPKQVHELGATEPEAPDGLNLEFIRLAVARNNAAWKDRTIETPATTLALHVSQQIGHAVLLERSILERLSGE